MSLENTPGDVDLQEIYLEANIKMIELCYVYNYIFKTEKQILWAHTFTKDLRVRTCYFNCFSLTSFPFLSSFLSSFSLLSFFHFLTLPSCLSFMIIKVATVIASTFRMFDD